MKILKHGYSVYRFKCHRCKCEFEMTEKELGRANFIFLFTPCHTCPDCGGLVKGELIRNE